MKERKDTEAQLDAKTKRFLDRFSKKKYSEEELKEAEIRADSKYKSKLGEIWDKVRLLFHIARHPGLWGAQYAAMAIAAVIYLVSPVDAIPDILAGVGLTDDIAVIGAIIGSIIRGLAHFTLERKMALRSSIPEDLVSIYDRLMGIKPSPSVTEAPSAAESVARAAAEGLSSVIGTVTSAQTAGGGFASKLETVIKAAPVFAQKVTQTVDAVVLQKIETALTQQYRKRLAHSAINLAIYLLAVLFVIFPVFGELVSSIISATLLIATIAYSVFRLIRFVITLCRNEHTVPLFRTILKMRSVKKGLSAYMRTVKFRGVNLGIAETVMDSFCMVLRMPGNKKTFDRLVDHVWNLLRKDVIRFVLVSAIIVVSFFLLRHVLIAQFVNLTFWQIVFHPFYVLSGR